MKQLSQLEELSDSFLLLKDKYSGDNFISSKSNGLIIKIKENGYIPKSGLLLIDYIQDSNISGINAVDIGTGETGVIAQNLYMQKKFENIWAVDIDDNAINHACVSSEISHYIKWVHSHCFRSLGNLKFDLIVSNPPQMPVLENLSLHDDGGKDGLDIIKILISEGSRYLTSNGRILLLCFDFLVDNGVIDQLAKTSGLYLEIKKSIIREIREGGRTMENLNWIYKVYPNFQVNYTKDKTPFHYARIIEFKRY